MNIHEMKRLVAETVEQYAEQICAFGEEALEMPEAGYKEYKSSAHMREAMEKLGLC